MWHMYSTSIHKKSHMHVKMTMQTSKKSSYSCTNMNSQTNIFYSNVENVHMHGKQPMHMQKFPQKMTMQMLKKFLCMSIHEENDCVH